MDKDKRVRRCLHLINEKRYSEAKELLKKMATQGDGISLGARMALKGIMGMRPRGEPWDLETLKRLRRTFKRRLTSTWGDELEKEYFAVWASFINLLGRHREQSVVGDPGKEPEDDKAPEARRD